ncbi:hypothetical protein WN55_08539 [Dufourea novaeangliae]|uniref:Uncharacterized protein n=1 Tax=Dufourea novaeangliae TaxID=178035 RepID=A0A154P5K4_DUFNO|nr:hypothetical protein WN55_08539 [Dufourea novaeangliae]
MPPCIRSTHPFYHQSLYDSSLISAIQPADFQVFPSPFDLEKNVDTDNGEEVSAVQSHPLSYELEINSDRKEEVGFADQRGESNPTVVEVPSKSRGSHEISRHDEKFDMAALLTPTVDGVCGIASVRKKEGRGLNATANERPRDDAAASVCFYELAPMKDAEALNEGPAVTGYRGYIRG